MSRKSLTDKDGEVRELTRDDLQSMKPAADMLPADLVAVLPKRKAGQRGPQRAPTKRQITLRLDEEVITYFREQGPGWQSRINETLKKAVKRAG
ncbi:BrnA antitoxin family protein [Pelagibacterium halotolerans]|uniref:BrnA antitoxin family protein n=1 Tax=Pelagibacterium halotolerans TaxID=531813 RepID=UPI00384B090E